MGQTGIAEEVCGCREYPVGTAGGHVDLSRQRSREGGTCTHETIVPHAGLSRQSGPGSGRMGGE